MIGAQASRLKHQFHRHQHWVETSDGHSSHYLRHDSITVGVTSQALLEKPQRLGQIDKRRAIAQRTGLAFDEWDVMLPVKTDLMGQFSVSGNTPTEHAAHDPGSAHSNPQRAWQVVLQLTEVKQMHQTLEQRHGHGAQALAETQTNLAVSERERALLAERLTRVETQLTELTTDKQLLLQDNAVLSSQLSESRAKCDQP